MTISIRLIFSGLVTLLPGATATAQPAIAPPPHLALDEFVKEYKRLGLPLPPPRTDLIRVKWQSSSTLSLGFGIPPVKADGTSDFLVGLTTTWYYSGERVKSGADALRNVEPWSVADLLCTAAQCRAIGLNEIAEVLYARCLEVIAKPMPLQWKFSMNQFGSHKYLDQGNSWRLYVQDDTRSALLELRHAAFGYWHAKIMSPGSDRKEVLRYLKVAGIGSHPDVRDLELTVAPRKSKPGTAEALIDDLTEYKSSRGSFGAPNLSDPQPGEEAYWKLAEMGFDAIPALLDHLQDSRFTRQARGDGNFRNGDEWQLSDPTHVGDLTRYLVRHFTGGDVSFGIYPDPRVDAVHAWWEKARKVGEEKWLLSLALPAVRDETFAVLGPDQVVLRVLGVKYPNRLAEIYRTVLRECPEVDSWALALEITASKLPRTEQLALLVEGAEHKRLVHRNAALRALARINAPLFRKYLLSTLKRLPPDVEKTWWRERPQVKLASLLWKTDDPVCWDALATAASWAPVDLRIAIIREFEWPEPNVDKTTRREMLRFLLGFLSDDTATKEDEYDPRKSVRDVATEMLVGQLALGLPYNLFRGPYSRLFIRAVVTKAAAEELARLKN